MFALFVALTATIVAQLLKPLFTLLFTGKFMPGLIFDSGSFPSSHTSSVTALTLFIGLETNFDSYAFAISFIFGAIVIYDAQNVRYYAGKNIELTKQLISDVESLFKTKFASELYHQKLKTVLGHKSIEVLGGAIVGVVVALVMFYLVPWRF